MTTPGNPDRAHKSAVLVIGFLGPTATFRQFVFPHGTWRPRATLLFNPEAEAKYNSPILPIWLLAAAEPLTTGRLILQQPLKETKAPSGDGNVGVNGWKM